MEDTAWGSWAESCKDLDIRPGYRELDRGHTRSLIYRQIKSKHEHFSSRPEKLSKAIAVLPFPCLAGRPTMTTLSYSMDVCRI